MEFLIAAVVIYLLAGVIIVAESLWRKGWPGLDVVLFSMVAWAWLFWKIKSMQRPE